MAIKKAALIASFAGWCLVPAAQAATGCDVTLTGQYKQYAKIVEQLRADKPGQMRVFAADGSEFTAGQARWMQGQLRDVEQACASGDQATAQRRLNAVGRLLKAHERGS
jgi:hypothetical protein